MERDLRQLSPTQVYFTLIQTLIPRPIAWVLTENPGGDYNLAPFSYFSAVSSDPPLLMLSVGNRSDGTPKDTAANIRAKRRFVIHIPHRELLHAMNDSSASLPPGESEVTRLGLALTPMAGFPLPRLTASRVAFGCQLYQMEAIGNAPQTLILGQVDTLYVDDRALTTDAKGRSTISATAIDPISRLGTDEYATLGEVIRLHRPA